MKQLIIIALLLVVTGSFAQNKNTQAVIEVDGVCLMCKARIEKACLSIKGVKSANWDVDTHKLKLFFDDNKATLKTIKSKIAAVGHDTQDIKATPEAYNAIHACCKYRDL